jgi:carbamate kinase
MPERILVALGGNALIREGQRGTIGEQAKTLRQSLAGVVELVRLGHRLIITHGNGPQVGHILIRVELSRGHTYDLPLDVCVAQSQGEIGYLIEQTLQNLKAWRARRSTRTEGVAHEPHLARRMVARTD